MKCSCPDNDDNSDAYAWWFWTKFWRRFWIVCINRYCYCFLWYLTVCWLLGSVLSDIMNNISGISVLIVKVLADLFCLFFSVCICVIIGWHTLNLDARCILRQLNPSTLEFQHNSVLANLISRTSESRYLKRINFRSY